MGIYLLDVVRQRDPAARRGAGLLRPDAAGARAAAAGHPLADRPGQDARATFYVADVYRGTGMERIARGTVKSLRVVESPEKRFWTGPAWDGGTGQQAPGMAWDDFNNKRILGTVPVEPRRQRLLRACRPTRFVYFQLLDERGHDGPVDAQRHDRPARRDGRLRRLPRGPPLGTARPHGSRRPCAARRSPLDALVRPAAHCSATLAEVQPVFDKHCVALPRLRQGGRREAEPGRRPGPGLQHLLRRAAQQEATSTSSAPGRPRCSCRRPGARTPAAWPKSLLDGHGDAGDRPPGAARPPRRSTASSPGSTSTPRTIPTTAPPIATISTAARRSRRASSNA